uniref:Dynein axonemal intermediate chain 4 n=1 Tax=Stegastes partitus TaxID=144197 RepID=A0A3B5A0Y9_9TELE
VSGHHGVNLSSRLTSSRRSLSLGGGSKILEKSHVFDEDGNDVTPQPLYQADPGATQAKGSRFFVDEISAGSASDQTTATGSFTMQFARSVFGSSRISSQSTIESVNEEMEDTFSKRDLPIPERNNQYAELCRNKMGNDKYVDRSMLTLNGAAKNKHVQTDTATVTTWDMYDTLCSPEQEETVGRPQPEMSDYQEAVMDSSRAAERSVSVGISASSSVRDVDASGSTSNTESEWQLIMLSESFQHSLLVMERCILRNNFQRQLAAYRQLPVLEDDSQSPALQCLWAFSCELSRGRSISSLAWNKKNPDILAVGYGQFDSGDQKQGLVCCWSIKNPTWPERFIHCDSAVTALDFSANSPSQLAVGMHDGSIAIYDLQNQDSKSSVISSRQCPDKHLGPVFQLRWIQQELSLESLFSVGADGRICKWFAFSGGLDCTDLMRLKSANKKGKTKEDYLSLLSPGLCFDFHPIDPRIYLTGTWEGLIHKCSCSNNQQFLETYKKHFCSVNCITWNPLSPDVFLSCSADWTIQLWKQDQLKPVLGFTSTQQAVHDVKWSPKWATVFGVVNEGQLEIWDLNSSIEEPVIVQPAAPGVTMTSLLFARQTDCVVVGDSDGQVTVYQVKNLSVGVSSQVRQRNRWPVR